VIHPNSEKRFHGMQVAKKTKIVFKTALKMKFTAFKSSELNFKHNSYDNTSFNRKKVKCD
jgi:hypothetical protein